MKNLLKTTSLILIIFSFFVTSGHAFSVEDSEFEVKIHWEIEDPGLGDQFSFGFNPDGTFGVGMPDLDEEYGEYGEYVELPIKSIPDLDLEINWIEAVWEDANATLKIWGSVSEYVLDSEKLEQPLRVQNFSGDGEAVLFQGGSEYYYPFAFLGSELPEEIKPQFLQAVPDSGYQGEDDKHIRIFCGNIKFLDFPSNVIPCITFENSGIETKGNPLIINDTSLKVTISIDEDAHPGKGDIIMNLGEGDTIIAENAFEVLEKDQPQFLRAVPDSGCQGETDKEITIFCANTEFKQQTCGIAFENRGIRINSIDKINDTSLKVTISIDNDAPRGKSDIFIDLSDNEITIVGKNAFEVKGVL